MDWISRRGNGKNIYAPQREAKTHVEGRRIFVKTMWLLFLAFAMPPLFSLQLWDKRNDPMVRRLVIHVF